MRRPCKIFKAVITLCLLASILGINYTLPPEADDNTDSKNLLAESLRLLVVTIKVDQAPSAVLGPGFVDHLYALADSKDAQAVIVALQVLSSALISPHSD